MECSDKLVETFHFVQVTKLHLAVSGDSVMASEIGRNLSALDFVEVVNPSGFRDVEFEATMNSNSLCITPYRNQLRLPDIEVGDMDSTLARTRPLLENLFAVNLLVNLKNPNPSFNVDVRVNGKDNDEVRIGSKVRFTVRVERDAYVYLVDVDASGKVTVLFPTFTLKIIS